jgi:hypothetical protein
MTFADQHELRSPCSRTQVIRSRTGQFTLPPGELEGRGGWGLRASGAQLQDSDKQQPKSERPRHRTILPPPTDARKRVDGRFA